MTSLSEVRLETICVFANPMLLLLFMILVRVDEVHDFLPSVTECKDTDVVGWCELRVSKAAATLALARVCADLALVDASVKSKEVAIFLKKSLWRGYDDHVCFYRNSALVIREDVDK